MFKIMKMINGCFRLKAKAILQLSPIYNSEVDLELVGKTNYKEYYWSKIKIWTLDLVLCVHFSEF